MVPVVEAQASLPYAIVGGILALLVFLIICVLVEGMVWCSVRQKVSGAESNSATACGWLWRQRGWGLEPRFDRGRRRSRIGNLRPRSERGGSSGPVSQRVKELDLNKDSSLFEL